LAEAALDVTGIVNLVRQTIRDAGSGQKNAALRALE